MELGGLLWAGFYFSVLAEDPCFMKFLNSQARTPVFVGFDML